MTTSRSFILIAALACSSACAIDVEPDESEEAGETVADHPDHPEASLPDQKEISWTKPGCGPQPTHWCEDFQVQASYPYPPGPFEPGFIGCINRADADLMTLCQQNGGLGVGCCGGNQPNYSNHDHPWAEWSNGAWNCTGRMRFRRPCSPGSTNPECEPACNPEVAPEAP